MFCDCTEALSFTSLINCTVSMQQKNAVSDGLGGFVDGWVEIIKAKGYLKPKNIKGINYNQSNFAEVGYSLIIRYNSLITDASFAGSLKVTIDGLDYGIVGCKFLDKSTKEYGKKYIQLDILEGSKEYE